VLVRNQAKLASKLGELYLVEILSEHVCRILASCQGQKGRGQRSGVIDRSILWNRVMYYIGEEYYLVMV